MGRLLSFKARSREASISRSSLPSRRKSNKRPAPQLHLRIVIKRLLLPPVLAMFNNYNSEREARGEVAAVG